MFDKMIFLIFIITIPLLSRLMFIIVKNALEHQKNKSNTLYINATKIVLNRYSLEKVVTLYEGEEDCFDPADNSIALSKNHNNNSIASVAIAMHEVGHALQFNMNWWLYRIRCYIKPFKNVFICASAFGIGMCITSSKYIELAVISVLCLMTIIIVELIVEIDASRKACRIYREMFETSEKEMNKFKLLLGVAAFTYVVDILECLLMIMSILLKASERERKSSQG